MPGNDTALNSPSPPSPRDWDFAPNKSRAYDSEGPSGRFAKGKFEVSEHGRLIVTEWRYEPPADCDRNRSRISQKSYSAWIGAAGSLLLHALFFLSVLLGAQVMKVRRPEVQGVGAARIRARAAPSETLILLNLSTPVKSRPPLIAKLASAGLLPADLPMTLISPDPLPHFAHSADHAAENQKAAAPINRGDAALRAALFGRYTGQIDARIERAWQRPRFPVNRDDASLGGLGLRDARQRALGDETFRCEVRILQNRQGDVQEVQLLRCNGDVTWQQSLVTAILAASPLPAPPSPGVFSDAITLTFVARSRASGGEHDEHPAQSMTRMTVGRN